MNRYEQSKLWQNSLAPKLNEDIHIKERELLRIEFEKFRDRAAVVAGEVIRDLPDFTVHDINHIDRLWTLADLITPDRFEITPAEAFVLGGAFLIHDLGMGLAAYPDGINELRKTTTWRDTVSYFIKKEFNRAPSDDEIAKPSQTIEKKSLENVLRILHAKHAEKLALIEWKGENGNGYYLIENTDLREAYGKIIGLIAHSHWWPVEDLSKKLSAVLGSPSKLPHEWEVDPIKLATILRVADAANIDDSRSPSFLKALRKLKGYSELHWNFQNKLFQPRLEKERLVYMSKSPFQITEADSWWLCYDTLKLLDDELREVDSLLGETGRQRLNVIGVTAVEDPERLSKLITVENWKPVDTQIRVGNVAQLALRLGGFQLYGKDYTVPVRELIQNASDAIRARRALEDEDENWGEIIIRKLMNAEESIFEIEDNGIGMSPKVLTGPFLDFGTSFWGSSLMHEELPGLESRKFESTGRYGIGFFSSFMIGDKISIFSRRYEEARENTWCLEFFNGVYDRPVLRKASPEEYIKDGGTKIRIKTKNDFWTKCLDSEKEGSWDLVDVFKKLCICLDVNVSYFDDRTNKKMEIVKANDWITIPFTELIERMVGVTNFKKIPPFPLSKVEDVTERERFIEHDGKIIGRGALHNAIHFRDGSIYGSMVVGGFNTETLRGIIGVVKATTTVASRDEAVPCCTIETFKKFIDDQISLITIDPKYDLHEYATPVAIASRLHSSTGNLPIAIHKKRKLNFSQFIELVKDLKQDIILTDNTRSYLETTTSLNIIYKDNVICFSQYDYYHENWLTELGLTTDIGTRELLLDAISIAWGISLKELEEYISEEDNPKTIIAYAGKIELSEEDYILVRYPYKIKK